MYIIAGSYKVRWASSSATLEDAHLTEPVNDQRLFRYTTLMFRILKNLGRRIIPKKLFKLAQPYWHGFWGLCAHYYYGKPSDKLIVIGVTGTKGKTSTAHITYQLLNNLGAQTGLISTAVIDSGAGEKLNWFRMTQLSGPITHKLLADMVRAERQYAVLEVSSEGLTQHRHAGINFDIALFTNLTPDHVDAHGSFEAYKEAKAILFKEVGMRQVTSDKKQINPKVQKTIIANLDSEYGLYYLNFKAEKHITYAINNTTANLVAYDIKSNVHNSVFYLTDNLRPVIPTDGFAEWRDLSTRGIARDDDKVNFSLPLPGKFNIYNTLAGVAVAQSLGFDISMIANSVSKLKTIPGRMEILQTEPFMVVIDYAHEKASMTALYDTINQWPHKRIIQVFGATGGVRDKSRRTDLGTLAGKFADIAIITDEDPFDEDPIKIIEDIATEASKQGKVSSGPSSASWRIGGVSLSIEALAQEERGMFDTDTMFLIPNRRQAIAKALSLAQPEDLVLITGKGAEQKIARANGQYEDWDDRTITREELLSRSH